MDLGIVDQNVMELDDVDLPAFNCSYRRLLGGILKVTLLCGSIYLNKGRIFEYRYLCIGQDDETMIQVIDHRANNKLFDLTYIYCFLYKLVL
jgi:hypothetical protein